MTSYKVLREFKHDASAKTELIERDGIHRVRKSVLSQNGGLPSFRRLQKQFEWLRHHSEEFRGFIPEVTGSELCDGYYAYEMKYYAMENLHEMVLSGQSEIAGVVLDHVLDFAFERIYAGLSPCSDELLRDYIDVKMIDRVRAVAELDPVLRRLSEYPSLVINGRECVNFLPLITKILESPKVMGLVNPPVTRTIHGDLTAENILGDVDGSFILIDVDTENVLSSPYLDLSKLMQSFHSYYEFLKASEEPLSFKANSIQYNPCRDERYDAIQRNLIRRLPELMPSEPDAATALLFYEASHFSRMLPYRLVDNPETAPVYYARAVELLNAFYDEAG